MRLKMIYVSYDYEIPQKTKNKHWFETRLSSTLVMPKRTISLRVSNRLLLRFAALFMTNRLL